ncbi:MAG: winged helix-turn-helix domain-containing protein [Methanocellales archaeon]|nr:winged helix-turn-helix domain-containing protein [Methanocellales archaeon]
MNLNKEGSSIERLSPLESEILLSLMEGRKSLSDLRASIKARDTSILHALKKLDNKRAIYKDTIKHSYSLTNIGHICSIMLNQFSKTSDVLMEMKDYWINHDLSGIPEHLLLRIGALSNLTVVKDTPSDLDAVHRRYLDSLKGSEWVYGVSPVFHSDFAGAIMKILGKGGKVKFVFTKEVLDRTRETIRIKELAKYVKRILIDRNLEIFIGNNLKVGLTVTDKFLSFGLFTLDGAYDYSADLMGSHSQALEWGEELFEYYRENSEKIRLSNIF